MLAVIPRYSPICGALQLSGEVLRELDHGRTRGGVAIGGSGLSAVQGRATGAAAMEASSRVGQHVAENTRDLPPVLIMETD